eukprot:tig00000852_g5049.t1
MASHKVYLFSHSGVKGSTALRFEELLQTLPNGQRMSVPLLKHLSASRTDMLAWVRQRGWHAQDIKQVVEQTESHVNLYLQLVLGLVDSANRHPDQVIRRYSQPRPSANASPFVAVLEHCMDGGDPPHYVASSVSFPSAAVGGFSGDSPCRMGAANVSYSWTNVVGSSESSSSNDAAFELLSSLVAFGHWWLAVASAAIEGSNPQEVSATTLAYEAFLNAAGIFEYVIEAQGALRFNPPPDCSDLLPAMLRAWSAVAVAHAEELALDWALRQSNYVEDSPLLLSRLATDIVRKQRTALDLIAQTVAANPHANHEARLRNPTWTDEQCARLAKLKAYLGFKSTAYEAIALYFSGAALNHVKRGSVVLRTVGRTAQAANASKRAIEMLEDALRGAHEYVQTLDASENATSKGAPASHLRALLDIPRTFVSKIPPPQGSQEGDAGVPQLPSPLQIAFPAPWGLPPLHPLWGSPGAADTDSGNWAQFQQYRQKNSARQAALVEEVAAPGEHAGSGRPLGSTVAASSRFRAPATTNSGGALQDTISGVTYIPIPGRFGGMASTQSSWASAPKEKRGAGFGPKAIAAPRGIPLEQGATRPSRHNSCFGTLPFPKPLRPFNTTTSHAPHPHWRRTGNPPRAMAAIFCRLSNPHA